MNPVFRTGSTIHAYGDSGPSRTRVETSMNVVESGRSYPLANILPQRKNRRGLTTMQRLGIMLAMLFLLYLAW